jgi:nucleoside permease NupC
MRWGATAALCAVARRYFGSLLSIDGLSFSVLVGRVAWPAAWLLGVEAQDCT